jgi:type IV pilus assembly protein PilB
VPILEILHMDGDLDELVARRATGRELRRAAAEKGFRTLADEGVARVLDGSTSIAEVSRSVDLTGRIV